MRRMSSMLDAATSYTSIGWRVVPLHSPDNSSDSGCSCARSDCNRPGKHPLIADWVNQASSDARVVTDWWTTWPEANIGLLTGVAFDVLDIDSQGLAAMMRVEAGPHLGGVGPIVATGRGLHLYLRHQTRRPEIAITPVDWMGPGHLVVAPPSLHASGHRYEFTTLAGSDAPLHDPPPWLLRFLNPPCAVGGPATPRHVAARATTARPIGLEDFDDLELASVTGHSPTERLAREAEAVASALEGSRNNELNKRTYKVVIRLVVPGHLPIDAAVDALADAGLRCGLPQREIEGTIRSATEAAVRAARR
jgi:hypothetical protein